MASTLTSLRADDIHACDVRLLVKGAQEIAHAYLAPVLWEHAKDESQLPNLVMKNTKKPWDGQPYCKVCCQQLIESIGECIITS